MKDLASDDKTKLLSRSEPGYKVTLGMRPGRVFSKPIFATMREIFNPVLIKAFARSSKCHHVLLPF